MSRRRVAREPQGPSEADVVEPEALKRHLEGGLKRSLEENRSTTDPNK